MIPSYRVQPNKNAPPLTSRQKLQIVVHGAYDPLGLGANAAEVLAFQYKGKPEGFCGYGVGWSGFAKCYGAGWVESNTSALVGHYLLATWWRQDPRYFPAGSGGAGRRALHALTRVLITRSDTSGGRVFNSSELAGMATSVALSNTYYARSQRGWRPSLSRLAIDVGGSAFFNLGAEFWPDVRRHLPH